MLFITQNAEEKQTMVLNAGKSNFAINPYIIACVASSPEPNTFLAHSAYDAARSQDFAFDECVCESFFCVYCTEFSQTGVVTRCWSTLTVYMHVASQNRIYKFAKCRSSEDSRDSAAALVVYGG